MKAQGEQIRRNREVSGRGLTEFAQRIGISPSYLSRIERDQANPSPGVMRRIAEELRKERRAREAIAEITDTERDGDDQPPE
ncbi:helix-turn-helix transcriptional regulator [Streptomyces sp. E5N91]|uniref:helix-turn-helix domain-containing protein n=1 Tax=Streptomyces sp. E5N91 TaxID=1851996 RepID=UPI00187D5431|nr:helix-turn-helix transcriptional regulator [Streptomyces sp. E5N91]